MVFSCSRPGAPRDDRDERCCSAEDEDAEDEPVSCNTETMAARAEGTMQPNPTRQRYALGLGAYTCFHMIHAPNPIRIISRKLCRTIERHFTSPYLLDCRFPDAITVNGLAGTDIWSGEFPYSASANINVTRYPVTVMAYPESWLHHVRYRVRRR